MVHSPHDEPIRQMEDAVAIMNVHLLDRSSLALHVDDEQKQPPCVACVLSWQRIAISIDSFTNSVVSTAETPRSPTVTHLSRRNTWPWYIVVPSYEARAPLFHSPKITGSVQVPSECWSSRQAELAGLSQILDTAPDPFSITFVQRRRAPSLAVLPSQGVHHPNAYATPHTGVGSRVTT